MKTDEVVEVQDEPLPVVEDLDDEDCDLPHINYVRKVKKIEKL